MNILTNVNGFFDYFVKMLSRNILFFLILIIVNSDK